jgi:hypothetical protein
MVEADTNVIRWSMQGGASIPPCSSGTVTRPAAHPMVHTGRYKHPALHLQYHLPGQLNMAPGGQHISCRSLPTSVCSNFNGTVFRRSMVWISLMHAAALAGGSWTVRLTPSKTNPITSFLVSKFPSPADSFLAEMGSLPSACFVTDVGGKNAWIPWIAACRMMGM